MSKLTFQDEVLNTLASIMNVYPGYARVHPKTLSRANRIRDILMHSSDPVAMRIRNLRIEMLHHYRMEQGMCKGIPDRMEPPDTLCGNTGVYSVLRKLCDHFPVGAKKHTREILPCVIFEATARGITSESRTPLAIRKILEYAHELTSLLSLATETQRLTSQARSTFETKMREWQKEGFATGSTPEIEMETISDGVQFVSLGPIDVWLIDGAAHAMLPTHTRKVYTILDTLFNVAAALTTQHTRYSITDIIPEWMQLICKIGINNPEEVGEYIKAARAIALAHMEKSNIFQQTTLDLVRSLMGYAKRLTASEIYSTVKKWFPDPVQVYNFLNLYKAIAHPDPNIKESFATLEGLHTPNITDARVISRFSGTLRRSLYKSLTAQGFQVRMNPISVAGNGLAELSQSAQADPARIQKFAAERWACTSFQIVRGLPVFTAVIPRPSDKSSQMAAPFTNEELLQAEAWAAAETPLEPEIVKAKTQNDATSVAKGDVKWDIDKAIQRFELILRTHETFEGNYDSIEAIPHADLANFVLNEPKARYLVGTEPKLGEYHKRISRMFYMAEKDLKMMTQATERIAKQMSRRQPGVSIVKSYSARRRDLENFCHAMSGREDDRQSVFVSFDMSEFSKKFPMELVRIYGQIMAEVSGVDFLRRIDLFFRAAVVIHNSRGFFAKIAGVMGGFEGFLNFVWSSIHAAIMEIALEGTGLAGELLTYSDDGLLLFYALRGANRAQVAAKVVAIQRYYDMFGLTFHLGKTMVSYSLWEYLGDVCLNGHLLPSWFKEICTIGREQATRGITPIRMFLSATEAQATSAVMAGADPTLAFIISLTHCIRRLSLRFPKIPLSTIAICLAIPTSVGGLRHRTAYEMTCVSTIDPAAEFMADMERYTKYRPGIPEVIFSAILSNPPTHEAKLRALLMGQILKSSMPDTSGISVINEAIGIVADYAVTKIARNPLTHKVVSQIDSVLRKTDSIIPSVLAKIIFASPAWNDYMSSQQLVQGTSAMRLIPRVELRRLQRKDTNLVFSSLSRWAEMIREPVSSRVGTKNFIDRYMQLAFSKYSIAYLKPSPRAFLTLTKSCSPEGIAVEYHPLTKSTISMAEYSEPRVRFSQDPTSVSWLSEATSDKAVASARKLVSLVASLVATAPASSGLFTALGYILGVDVPDLPPGLAHGAHRRSKAIGLAQDVRILIPRYFHACSTSRYVGLLERLLREQPRADRTTYLESAKALAYFHHDAARKSPSATVFMPEQYVFNVNAPSAGRSFVTPQMEFRGFADDYQMPGVYIEPMPELVQREFRTTFLETSRVMNALEEIDDAQWNDMIRQPALSQTYLAITHASVVKWITTCCRSSHSSLIQPTQLPSSPFLRKIIIKRAIYTASWDLLDSHTRALCRQALDYRVNGVRLLTAPGGLRAHKGVPAAIQKAVGAYRRKINVVCDSLAATRTDLISSEDLDTINNSAEDVSQLILVRATQDLLITQNSPRTEVIVMRPRGADPASMTHAHESAFRRMFSTTLDVLKTVMRVHNFNDQEATMLLGLPGQITVSDVETWIAVVKPLIRYSEHRRVTHPYNRTSAIIELVKFSILMNNLYLNMPPTEEEALAIVDNWTIPAEQLIDLREQIRRVRNMGDVGEDHARILTQPLTHSAKSRALTYIKSEYRAADLRWGIIGGSFFQVISLINLNDALFNFFIDPTARSIVEVDPAVEKMLVSGLKFPPALLAQAVGLTIEHQGVFGTEVDRDLVTHNDHWDRLMAAHLYSFCIHTNLVGVDIGHAGYASKYAVEYGLINPGGEALAPINAWDWGAVTPIAREFETVDAALTTYITLANSGFADISIWREDDPVKYFIAGFHYKTVEHDLQVLDDREPPLLNVMAEDDELNLDDLIPTADFRQVAHDAVVACRDRLGSTVLRARDHHALSLEYIRRVGGGHFVNNFSPELQAAVIAAREVQEGNDQIWAYTLLYCYITNRPNLLIQRYLQLLDVVQRGTAEDRMQIRMDISTCCTWLKHVSIHLSPAVDGRAVIDLLEAMPRREDDYVPVIRDIINMMPVRPMEEIADDVLRGFQLPHLGHVARWLLVVPAVPPAILQRDDEVIPLNRIQ